jgi:hypothetical protein
VAKKFYFYHPSNVVQNLNQLEWPMGGKAKSGCRWGNAKGKKL